MASRPSICGAESVAWNEDVADAACIIIIGYIADKKAVGRATSTSAIGADVIGAMYAAEFGAASVAVARQATIRVVGSR